MEELRHFVHALWKTTKVALLQTDTHTCFISSHIMYENVVGNIISEAASGGSGGGAGQKVIDSQKACVESNT